MNKLAKRNVGLISKSQTQTLITIALVVLVIYLIMRSRGTGTVAKFSNLESWNWVDWKGRDRQITVHRESKAS